MHSPALLESKRCGLDQARRMEDWNLPVYFGILGRRLKSELGVMGTRESNEVLKPLERHSLSSLKHEVQHGLEIGATAADSLRLNVEYQ